MMKKTIIILCLIFCSLQARATEWENCEGRYSYRSDSTSISFRITINGVEDLLVDNLAIDKGSVSYKELGISGSSYLMEVSFTDKGHCFNIIKFMVVLDDNHSVILVPGYYIRSRYDKSTNKNIVKKKECLAFEVEQQHSNRPDE